MVFERLRMAGMRLLSVIEQNRGGANKDLAKFTSQIDALCDKYER
jgi:metallo-beta-lactamase family protein